jgi:calcineurin-like phosphoesterase family protein
MIWILGNHDRKVKEGIMSSKGRDIKICQYMEEVGVNGQEITLCHYSMRKWNKSHYGTWHLYGHSHGTLPPYGLSMDVGVDNQNFYPVSFDEVKARMNGRLANHSHTDLGLVKPISHFD